MSGPTFTFSDGRTVNRLGYGAMRLTGQPANFGPFQDWDGGKALLRRAVELGVQFFDTARAYGPHWNERLIADALSPFPNDVMIATKGGIEKDGPSGADIRVEGRPEALQRHIDESLASLGVESIDLYYLHRPDPKVPLAESIGAIEDARKAGKVARIGVSNVTLEQLKATMAVAPISAVQNRFDTINGGDEDIVSFTRERGIAFVPWGPLGAHPLKAGSPLTDREVAHGTGSPSPTQLAIRHLLNISPNVLPIPGTTSINHLEENVNAIAESGV